MTRAKAMVRMNQCVSAFLEECASDRSFTASEVSQYVNRCDKRFSCMNFTAGILLRRRDDVNYDEGIWTRKMIT